MKKIYFTPEEILAGEKRAQERYRKTDKYLKAARAKSCARSRLKRANFTQELVDKLLVDQKNCCAVCRRPFLHTPFADHDHETRRPRGLLCRFCNFAEGCIKKTGLTPMQFARLLKEYLAHPPAENI